jgi:hypothetical protein
MKINLLRVLIVSSLLFVTACASLSNPTSAPSAATAFPQSSLPANATTSSPTAIPATLASSACQAKSDNPSSDGGAPLGCNLVLPSVSKGGNYDLGREVSLALDDQDDPMIAFVVYDPNGDTNPADSTLNFVRWDRTKRSWKEPVVVDVVANVVTNPPNRQVSLAHDSVTGALGIAYMKGEQQVWLAQSSDGGVTWTKAMVDSNDFTMDNPTLAMRGGVIDLAYNSRFVRCSKSYCDAVVYRSRTSATGDWSRAVVPEIPNTSGNRRFSPIGLALDSTGRPGLAYYLEFPNAAPGIDADVLAFWRPDEKTASKIADSATTSNDFPSLALAFDGVKPRVAYLLHRDKEVTSDLWFSASDDGKSWGAPVGIPRDGRDMTDWDLSLVLDSRGRAAIAAYWHTETKSAPGRCGGPKLFRSSDLQTWSSCGVDIRRGAGTQGRYVSVSFTRGDKLMIAFQNQINSNLSAGIFLYREP